MPKLTPAQVVVLSLLCRVADARLCGAELGAARGLARRGLARSLADAEPLPRGQGQLWAATDEGRTLGRRILADARRQLGSARLVVVY